ncbi:hypothetical protein CJ030_MR8G026871 [Morella rubra]|uniref:Uncharacterized protein n=1 Tax=Morella rubra TaxID=262757 RepID=A0A6A1UUB7_9ROSI|nr:hypothetical protein CJ030_MR8G026871 [Morella rubra]
MPEISFLSQTFQQQNKILDIIIGCGYLPESDADSSLRVGSVGFLDRAEDLGGLTHLRVRNWETEAVGDDVSREETKCFRVASSASEVSFAEEEEEAFGVLVLAAVWNRELRHLAVEPGIGGYPNSAEFRCLG